MELFARRRWDALGELDCGSGWTAERWQEIIEDYFAEHDDVGIGPDARGPALLIIDRQPGVWKMRQILDDPAEDRDWGIEVEVDLEASDEEGAAVLRVVNAGRLDCLTGGADLVDHPDVLSEQFLAGHDPAGTLEFFWRHPAPEVAAVLDALGGICPTRGWPNRPARRRSNTEAG